MDRMACHVAKRGSIIVARVYVLTNKKVFEPRTQVVSLGNHVGRVVITTMEYS
jgi:hypothetical protein